MANDNNGTTHPDEALLPQLQRLLAPLAGIAVGRVSYDVLADLLKQALIQAAEHKLRMEEPAKRITKSALALQTGIDSRLIDRNRRESDSDRDLSHPFADLLAMWQWNPEWHDPEGHPVLLPIYGGGRSFQTLVNRAIGKNISYSEVMEGLLKSRNIERTEDGRLRLVDPIFKYGASELEAGRFDFYGRMAEGLAHCIRERLACPEFVPTPNAVLMVVRSIPEERLEALAEEMGELLLRHADEAGDRLDAVDDENAEGRTVTAGVGNFFWSRRNE